jgi:hypothetical protein
MIRTDFNRLLKNAHLRCSPHPSSLRRTSDYVSLLAISGALHLGIFDQPEKMIFPRSFSLFTMQSRSFSGKKARP